MYALSPARRARQIAADLAVLAWCAAWGWAAWVVHGLVLELAAPARSLQRAVADLGTAMTDAGTTMAQVPFAGAQLQQVFARIAGVGAEAGAAGAEFETTVGRLALALALVTGLAPALGLGIPWLVQRVRFTRRATAARAFLDSEADLDLFALRAMANQPLPRLAAITPDPVGDWRRGDTRVVHALAGLELRSLGLRAPAVPAERPAPGPGSSARRASPGR